MNCITLCSCLCRGSCQRALMEFLTASMVKAKHKSFLKSALKSDEKLSDPPIMQFSQNRLSTFFTIKTAIPIKVKFNRFFYEKSLLRKEKDF